MIEVMRDLFVGNQIDDETMVERKGWYFVHAARDPYHRRALGGYGRAAPKDNPEYLIARRNNEMMLNLLDPVDVAYIPHEIMDAAVSAIHENLPTKRVLVHCNQGRSRAPTIAMLYMAKHGPLREMLPFEVVQNFKRIYPEYAPAEGMRLYAQRWLDENLAAA